MALDLAISSDTGKQKTFSVDLFTKFTLSPKGNQDITPANFALGLHCDKKPSSTGLDTTTWMLHGTAQNVSVGLLASFFDNDDSQDGVMAVMGKLNLRSLELLYTYQSQTASSFLITGVLVLGDLEMDLSYQYVSTLLGPTDSTATSQYLDANPDGGKLPSNPDDHFTTGAKDNTPGGKNNKVQSKFVASLSATSPGSTVASIAESIKPGAGDALPEWVGGIQVNPKTASGDAPIAELEFSSVQTKNDGETGNVSVLTFWLSIDGFTLTFVQFKTAGQKSGATTKPGTVKRILRISVDQIPLMNDIPLISELPQPFDHLEYLWVEDESTGVDPTLQGITRAELAQIGDQYPDNIPPLQVKDSKPPQSSTTPDIVLQAGHHFLVVVKGKVILDHVFHADRANTQPPTDSGKSADTGTTTDSGKPSVKEASTEVKPAEPPPTSGSTKTSAGPLSVSGLTFQFKNPSLFVTVDATLQLGPLNFSVIGFTLEIELSKVKLDNLAAIVTQGLIHVSLHGIECGVNQGPLTLEGVFIHDVTATTETYSGGIAVAFTAWQVLAVGQYTIKKAVAGADGFRAVFVYVHIPYLRRCFHV